MQAYVIHLTEYEPTFVSPDDLPAAEGLLLWQHYAAYIDVVFPAPPNGNRWKLTAKGWVGHLPLSASHHLVLHPRIAFDRWFDMLLYTTPYKAFRAFKGRVQVAGTEGLPAALIALLVERTRARLRQGLYRPFQAQTAALEFVRGRLHLPHHLRTPWQARLVCTYDEQHPNVPDNQLLAWTLHQLLHAGWCPPALVPRVRDTLRALQLSGVDVTRFEATAALNRTYHPLNADYAALHALCYFFLAHMGPALDAGPRAMIPFLMHMPTVFERFVAGWLRYHIPRPLYTQTQRVIRIDKRTVFRADQVLCRTDGTPLCVLDTKYKPDSRPATDDLAQVVAYAVALGCTEAVLIYPGPIEPVDLQVGRVHVRSLAFDLEQDLERAGRDCLSRLLEGLVSPL